MCADVPKKVATEESSLAYLRKHIKNGHIKNARSVCGADDGVLSSGISQLDAAFAQSAAAGKIIEWGTPPGRNGRLIPLLFLRNNSLPAIWVYAEQEMQVYAPAWASYGIDLQRLFFIRSNQPVKQLRPLFLDNSFKIIVLDAPQKLSRGELAFISSQARRNKQIIFLLRNYFLSKNNGTALAALRVNCWQNSAGGHSINFIKGRQVKKIHIDISAVLHHEQ